MRDAVALASMVSDDETLDDAAARRTTWDEVPSEFALAHVEGPATVAADARDELLEKRRPVMQRCADCVGESGSRPGDSVSPARRFAALTDGRGATGTGYTRKTKRAIGSIDTFS